MSLTVTGTIGIDTVFTPDGQHRENVLGGSCTYFAAAASFYTPVRMVAVVGDDFPADFRRTIARFANVDTAGLETRSGSKTFRWGGRYQPDMDHRDTLYTELNVLTEAPPRSPQPTETHASCFLPTRTPRCRSACSTSSPAAGLPLRTPWTSGSAPRGRNSNCC